MPTRLLPAFGSKKLEVDTAFCEYTQAAPYNIDGNVCAMLLQSLAYRFFIESMWAALNRGVF